MVPELHVTDIVASLAFWRDLLGFAIAYERPAEKFIYLEHADGAQAMLCQRNGRFETGAMTHPLGQGVMFQVYMTGIEPVLTALTARNWPIYLGPREIWRQVGARESGQREVFVQDPDGYLVMVASDLGWRAVTSTPVAPPG
jgi:catechol 2,3-dioxygenase-like lactoylglutathione lyase family enzyme